MWITIISTLIGFMASVVPALIKLWEKNKDYNYELELRRLEIQAAQEGIALQTRLEQIKAVVEQNRAIYEHDESIVSTPFINTLRASVRPILTYAFFAIFIIIKLVALFSGILDHLAIDALIKLVWDDYTATIFSSIMAFWYGSRIWENNPTLINRTANIIGVDWKKIDKEKKE